MRWRLKSPASRLFTQTFVQAQIKKNHQSSASLAFVAENSPRKWNFVEFLELGMPSYFSLNLWNTTYVFNDYDSVPPKTLRDLSNFRYWPRLRVGIMWKRKIWTIHWISNKDSIVILGNVKYHRLWDVKYHRRFSDHKQWVTFQIYCVQWTILQISVQLF